MKVQWTRLALRRADEAAAYIARDSPSAASRWLAGLRDAARRLEDYPESGRVAADLAVTTSGRSCTAATGSCTGSSLDS